MKMENMDIRLMVSDNGITYKDIAAVLGMHNTSISRMMSKELNPRQRERILYAISCIEARRDGTDAKHAAIDALDSYEAIDLHGYSVRETLEQLLAVQPELMIKLVDARKGLHEKCTELFHNENVAESIYIYLCDGLEECDVKPERKPGQWIPCSERLPEKAEGRYWVCTNTGYQCQCRWTDDVYGLGSNGEWAWKIFDIPQYSHVVAWRPLPEPYKEAET